MAQNLLSITPEIFQAKAQGYYDYIVVGAGVFGSAFASTMGKQGRTVLLVERDFSEPDRIVGELLQPGGCQALSKLGLEHTLEDLGGIPVHGYVVYFQNKPVHIPYTKDPITGKSFVGKSFHHGRFVSALRNAAKSTQNVTTLEASVSKLIYNPNEDQIIGISCMAKGSDKPQYYFGSITVVADGCFSKFRKAVVNAAPDTMSNFVGYVLEDCPLPYPNHGHVILAKEGPVLLYQIGDKDTRVLIDVTGQLPSASNGDLKNYVLEKVIPYTPKEIQGSFISAVESQKPRSMPNSFLPPSSQKFQGGGLIVAGDAFNMRHPLTGGGMTVALWDVVQLSELLSPKVVPSLDSKTAVLSQLDLFQWQRKNSSSVINVLACALYALFQSENDDNLLKLQEGCFEYFRLGGECVDGPVSFLSGVNGNPAYLVYHFFCVCLYSQYLLIAPQPLLLKPWAALKSMSLFLTGCRVILPLLFKEFQGLIGFRTDSLISKPALLMAGLVSTSLTIAYYILF